MNTTDDHREIPAQLVNMKRTTWNSSQSGNIPDSYRDEAVGSSNGLLYIFKFEYHGFTDDFSAVVIDRYSREVRRGEMWSGNNEAAGREWLLQKWHEMKCLK